MKSWEKMIDRKDGFKVTMGTKVCSNHFRAGYCSDVCPVPMLYMKGYDTETSVKHDNIQNTQVQLTQTLNNNKIQAEQTWINNNENTENNNQTCSVVMKDHNYCMKGPPVQKFGRPVSRCIRCLQRSDRIVQLTNIVTSQEKRIKELEKQLEIAKLIVVTGVD